MVLRQYTKTSEAKKAAIRDKRIIEKARGEYRLTLDEKRKILTDSIYGVDIDAQAVEVTKLSLYLKLLEGEGMTGGQVQLALAHEKILPKLDANIKCGNSLIGPDFYDDKDMGFFPDEDLVRINVFDWGGEGTYNPKTKTWSGRGFPDIMKNGGFDCVIGNPPYGSIIPKDQLTYIKKSYNVFSKVLDIYPCFIEKSTVILKRKGFVSFIVPSAWIGGPDYSNLREAILEKKLKTIVLLPFDIFKDAYIDTLVFSFENEQSGESDVCRTYIFPKKAKISNSLILTDSDYQRVMITSWKHQNRIVLDSDAICLIEKISSKQHRTFNDVIRMKRGVLFDGFLLLLCVTINIA